LWFDAALDLPQGAQITRIELEGCDSSATAHVTLALFVFPSPSGSLSLARSVGSTDAAIPGCTFFSLDTTADNIFVDRSLHRYQARIEISGLDANTSVRAARVGYKLRVSPAPTVATYTDVPTTHPFFRFVEALNASGITGGCGGGNYCPDAPVTRGQMAVFLSGALGLHFPN
jgi:hypothetical protein